MHILIFWYLIPLAITLFFIIVDVVVYRHDDGLNITEGDFLLVFCPVLNVIAPMLLVWSILEAISSWWIKFKEFKL